MDTKRRPHCHTRSLAAIVALGTILSVLHRRFSMTICSGVPCIPQYDFHLQKFFHCHQHCIPTPIEDVGEEGLDGSAVVYVRDLAEARLQKPGFRKFTFQTYRRCCNYCRQIQMNFVIITATSVDTLPLIAPEIMSTTPWSAPIPWICLRLCGGHQGCR